MSKILPLSCLRFHIGNHFFASCLRPLQYRWYRDWYRTTAFSVDPNLYALNFSSKSTNMFQTCFRRYQTSASVYVIPIVYGMIGIARTGSVYLTMSVTLERYFAIVRPLASFRIKRCLIPISITFAGLYNIPRFFELERYNFTYTNETLVRATKLRENSIYVSIYNTWMKMVSIKCDYFLMIF